MLSRAPIDSSRIRRITGSFSWLDHRLVTQGFLETMTSIEMLLYFFLVLVGDKNGVSFYGYDKICRLLKLNAENYIQARNGLLDKSLIAFDGQGFQVLALPQLPAKTSEQNAGSSRATFSSQDQDKSQTHRSGTPPKSLADIFKQPA